MKKVLIISPHFPPVNAVDIHRVRQSLPYYELYGYQPTVLTVLPDYVEMPQDVLLLKSFPEDIPIHRVKAYSTTYSRKLGLGNLGLRAFRQLYKKGNELLESGDFDLIYFSTTVFACVPLGRLWKRKFKVPFIIDMQDPWRNDYYLTVPKNEQPPKFWFAYRLNATLEKFTIPYVDGLLSVSQGYIDTLKMRYPKIIEIPSKVLTFGADVTDFEILSKHTLPPSITFNDKNTNIVCVGRGGQDMKTSITLLLKAFKRGLDGNENYKKCHFWFIGTSYAPDGQGKKTVENIAESLEIGSYVTEITNRLPYFEALAVLIASDGIVIPGSDDKDYTASKLYPNILAKKPMLCVLHSNSNAVAIVKDLEAGDVVLFDSENAIEQCHLALSKLIMNIPFTPNTNWKSFERFTAEYMTKSQCGFFDLVISES